MTTPSPAALRAAQEIHHFMTLRLAGTSYDYRTSEIARIISEQTGCDELHDALKSLWAFVGDLQKSNPGYLGKLVLQDYAQMNEAFLKTERVFRKLSKSKGTNENTTKPTVA